MMTGHSPEAGGGLVWTHGLHPQGSGSPSALGTSRKVRGKREEAVFGCVLASLRGTPGEYFLLVGDRAVGSRPPVSEYSLLLC